MPGHVVVDASVMIEAILRTPLGEEALATTADDDLVAPSLVDVEVAQVLRRMEACGSLPPHRAGQAIADLWAAAVDRYPLTPLLPEVWWLRGHLSAYDACYVALARSLGCDLVTADRRLARAPGLGVRVTAL